MNRVYTSVRAAVQDLQRFIYKILPAAGMYALHAAAKRIQRRMQESGKPIRYPVQWDSVRQMIAYFASDGFGEGIPYVRKNRYEQGWELTQSGDVITLGNREESARFIAGLPSGADLSPGKKQSNIHRGRWNLFRPVVDEEIKLIPRDVAYRLRLESSK